MSGLVKLFVNSERKLRNGWWVATFFLGLAVIVFPAIILSSRLRYRLTVADQALLIAAVTILCQVLRGRSIVEVTGQPDIRWLSQLGTGMAAGALLMAVPAFVLTSIGAIRWQFGMFAIAHLITGVETMAAVAIAEELLFRGFFFQRLVDGLGAWPAQLVVGGLFLLTHLNNPGMTGATRFWAGSNIFLASILFGLAFLRTQNQSSPSSPDIRETIETASKACPQSTMNMVNAWSEQLVENPSAAVSKLSWQETEDRIKSAKACVTLIVASEAWRDPHGKQENSSPRALAYQTNASRVIEACLVEQKTRLLAFIEAKGLKNALRSSLGKIKEQ